MVENLLTGTLDEIDEPKPVDIWEGVDAGVTNAAAETIERRQCFADRSSGVRDVKQVDGGGDPFEGGCGLGVGAGAEKVRAPTDGHHEPRGQAARRGASAHVGCAAPSSVPRPLSQPERGSSGRYRPSTP